MAPRHLRRDTAVEQVLEHGHAALPPPGDLGLEHLRLHLTEDGSAGLDHVPDRRSVAVRQVPAGDRGDHAVGVSHELGPEVVVDGAVDLLDRRPPPGRVGDVPSDPERADHVGGLGPGLCHEPRDEDHALGIHHVGRQQRGHELVAERVGGDLVSTPVRDRVREVAERIREQVRVLDHRRLDQRLLEAALGIGEEHGDLGSGHPLAQLGPLRHRLRRRHRVDAAIQDALLLEADHQVLVGVEPAR